MNFYELQDHFKKNGMGDVKKADPRYLRIMSSNTLHPADRRAIDPEAIPSEERMEILSACYLAYEPDFLGVQEVDVTTEPVLCKCLDSVYSIVEPKYPTSGDKTSPVSGIFISIVS